MERERIEKLIVFMILVLGLLFILWPVYLGVVGIVTPAEAVERVATMMVEMTFGPIFLASALIGMGWIFIPIGLLILVWWLYRNR